MTDDKFDPDESHFSDEELEAALAGFEKEFADDSVSGDASDTSDADKTADAASAKSDSDANDDTADKASADSGRPMTDDVTGSVADAVNEAMADVVDPSLGFDNELAGLLGNKAKVALNNLKIAGAELGETMMATLAPIIDQIVVKLQEFSAWFTSLDESQKQIILVIGAVVAAIGPAVVVIGKIVSGVGSIITAVGTVVGVITGTVIPAITGFVTTVGIVPIAILAAAAAIIAAIALFGDQIQAVLQGVDDFLQGVFATDWTNIFGPVLGEVLNAFFANVKNIWDSIKMVFDGIIDFIRGVFTGNWERAWTGVKEIFGGIFDGLKAVAKAPLNAIIGMVNMAISGINGVIGGLNKIPGVNIGEIGKIPYLAKGGVLSRGSAVVGEAGPELLTMSAGRAVVQPLTNNTTNNSASYGNVTINVYGAAGQNVNELADIIMYKMQGHVERREAVWT
mgnify:CR=1 FL=1